MLFPERMNEYRIFIENSLEKCLPIRDISQSRVIEAMRYSLLAGGKRLRPVIMLEFCRLFSGTYEQAREFACALEMIHTYSLIHDDLPCMDNDDLRRGRPTNHKVFGEDIAVLAGDGLLNYAFETALKTDKTIPANSRLEALKVLSRYSGVYGMLGGQTIDVSNNGVIPDIENLNNMYSLKTGALINCAGQIGCILGGANEGSREAVFEYTSNIGLAFQIVDDILDIEGDAAVLGKNIGCDKAIGKTTYPAIVGMEQAKKDVATLTNKAKSALSDFNDTSFLLELSDMLIKRKN
ncbi:MAG: polyprenyl synthetase family protein [Clostridiales bacterium]|nr:polyprenyl synthetase family protein [Clostridiales bacterium]